MPRRHRSAGRRSRRPLARLAVPVAIPVALVVVVGAIVAVVDHSGANNITDAANANCASPAAYVMPGNPANAAGHGHHGSGSTASPTATASSTAAPHDLKHGPPTSDRPPQRRPPQAPPDHGRQRHATAAPCPATARNRRAAPCHAVGDQHRHDDGGQRQLRHHRPGEPAVGAGTGHPVPAHRPGRDDPGAVRLHHDQRGQPGRVRPGDDPEHADRAALCLRPAGHHPGHDAGRRTDGADPAEERVVTIDFGFNGTVLTQVGATANALQQGNCVNGQGGSVFGQVSFCNGTNFFNEAFQLEREGKLRVPSEGTSSKIVASGGSLGTGQDCPTMRNFDMVDQDQSDNVTTEYLLNPATGQTAQNTTSNAGNLAGATALLNGSDNTLLDLFMDPTLGCTPFMAPDLANNNQPTILPGAGRAPRREEPAGHHGAGPGERRDDPGRQREFRRRQDQHVPGGSRPGSGQQPEQPARQPGDVLPEHGQHPDPVPGGQPDAARDRPVAGARVGNNLFTFMANRLSMSFTNLDCQNFGLTDPVTVTLDGNGVAVAATFNTTLQTATNTTGHGNGIATASPASTATAPSGHRRAVAPPVDEPLRDVATPLACPARRERRSRPHRDRRPFTHPNAYPKRQTRTRRSQWVLGSLLGADSLIACIAVGPIMSRRNVRARSRSRCSSASVTGWVTCSASPCTGRTRTASASSRRRSSPSSASTGSRSPSSRGGQRRRRRIPRSRWGIWILPWLLSLDNITFGAVNGVSSGASVWLSAFEQFAVKRHPGRRRARDRHWRSRTRSRRCGATCGWPTRPPEAPCSSPPASCMLVG